tara:strand:- start:21896 stop:22375 length:480 start_codon:yes stop_codon:yes gene_type:complete
MGLEIERKFLVTENLKWKELSFQQLSIRQAYLNKDAERTVRVRISNDKAFLTIKGKKIGIRNFEWEKEIPKEEAEQLLLLCELYEVEKVRYAIQSGEHTIELDVFKGENSGLIIAEIELASEEEEFTMPSWFGAEVSVDYRYSNSYLSTYPFQHWKKDA